MIPLFRLLDDNDESARRLLDEKLRERHAGLFEAVNTEDVLEAFFADYNLREQS